MKPNPLFSDHAVLQRGIPVPVWGSGDEGESVTVEFQEQRVSTTCRNGKWLVRLSPLEEGGPFRMTIAGNNRVVIEDILVGEVWLAAGQSNMAWPLGQTDLATQEIAASGEPMLRVARVPMGQSLTPVKSVDLQWKPSSPETSGVFSAVAYHFGRELRAALGCPIGLIDNSRGGTRIESWMSPNALAPFEGQYVRDAVPPTAEIPVSPHTASNLYNAMALPLIPYAIRGFIWYQGESNAQNAYLYRSLFPAMIADWRAAWGQGNIPFLFVQLAPCGQPAPQPEGSMWAEVREAQLHTAKTVHNTAMAVITDRGAEDAHPTHKKTIGERLGLAARALAYDKPVAYIGPYFRSMSVSGSEVVVHFDNADGGLVAPQELVLGFAMAGEDRTFHEATATVEGESVRLRSDSVTHPVAVRYGWCDRPEASLYNRHGLPASPFRTDDFPMRSAAQQPPA